MFSLNSIFRLVGGGGEVRKSILLLHSSSGFSLCCLNHCAREWLCSGWKYHAQVLYLLDMGPVISKWAGISKHWFFCWVQHLFESLNEEGQASPSPLLVCHWFTGCQGTGNWTAMASVVVSKIVWKPHLELEATARWILVLPVHWQLACRQHLGPC